MRGDPLEAFLAGAPPLTRLGLRALVALARRSRGARLLARVEPAGEAAHAVLSLAHYDEPAIARPLGWDAAAVVARGRALRRREGRP